MGKASGETKQREHERGQSDAKEHPDGWLDSFRGPWGRMGESDEHFKDRVDAYEAGHKNYCDQTDDS